VSLDACQCNVSDDANDRASAGYSGLTAMENGFVVVERLAIIVQFTVVVTLFAYFWVLRRTVRLEEVRLWTGAWFADSVALLAVLLLTQVATHGVALRLALMLYLAGKTAFVLLMVAGARNHVRPGAQPNIRPAPLGAMIVVWSLGVGWLADRVVVAQLAQSVMVGVVLATGGWIVLRNPRSQISRWLGFAFALESLVFLAYAVFLAPTLAGGSALSPLMPYSSFLDAWVEMVLALSCLAAVADRSEEQLRYANRELLGSQEQLSRMVDTDPLTGLANRRALRPVMDRATSSGAALVFVDINDFKGINDRFGHPVGDRVLQRLANLLREVFRPEDVVVRYGGDEYLVVAPGMAPDSVHRRVDDIRARMSHAETDAPAVTLAIGVTEIEVGGDPAAALVRADHLMYHDKPGARPGTGAGATRVEIDD
jgi:diguanylate cyclase (GGDEF)-like protein